MTIPAARQVQPEGKPRRVRSLASRLVIVGVIQLLLLAATAVVIFIAEGPHRPGRPDEYLSPALIHRLEAIVAGGDTSIDNQAEIDGALADLLGHRIEASLYDRDRKLVASNVDPPLAVPDRRKGPHPGDFGGPPLPPLAAPGGPPGPPPGDQGAPFLDGRRPDFGVPPPMAGEGLTLRIQVHGDRGFLIARGIHGEPPGLTGPILVLVLGFVILIVGALITARWIVRPIESLTTTARALGAGDLGARSRLARSDEIGELGVRVDEMADRIQTLLRTEKELLANVAHELRTPLSRIGVALDLAGEGDAVAARAALAEISVDVAELEAIVDDILTAMRAEVAGTLPLRRAVIEPREIADGSASRMRIRHPERPLTVEVADSLPSLDADPILFRRVIDNLLENAHKYSPDRDAPIDLRVASEGSRVTFTVRDRGIGIPAEDLPRVFTAFFRGDRSRSRETGGVGLGLTLAKRIVDAHDGTIDVTSEAGAGTTVRVSIPEHRG